MPPRRIIDIETVARTRPPAKLNLFLELIARRDDGFHQIDTIMVPIDWCDELSLQRTIEPRVELSVDWLPSRDAVAVELGIDPNSDAAKELLEIPSDHSNLVHRALSRFLEQFPMDGGFRCQLGKLIPAGAGMGGASSDAASALLCAAKLCNVPTDNESLNSIAAEIGSDVPFFLGDQGATTLAARATGRGEKIESLAVAGPIEFLVVAPAITLSTALVYADSLVPQSPVSGDSVVSALKQGDRQLLQSSLLNRLTAPAQKNAPQIKEILESMWRNGLRTCQLTGSGSACFAITASSNEAMIVAEQIRGEFGGPRVGSSETTRSGVRAKAVQSAAVPAKVELTSPS